MESDLFDGIAVASRYFYGYAVVVQELREAREGGGRAR